MVVNFAPISISHILISPEWNGLEARLEDGQQMSVLMSTYLMCGVSIPSCPVLQHCSPLAVPAYAAHLVCSIRDRNLHQSQVHPLYPKVNMISRT